MNYIDMVIAIDEEIKSVNKEIKELDRKYLDDKYSVDLKFPYRLTYKDVISGFLKAEDFKTYEDARNFIHDNNISGIYTIVNMMLEMMEMFTKDFESKNEHLQVKKKSLYEVRYIFYSKLSNEEKSKVGTYR